MNESGFNFEQFKQDRAKWKPPEEFIGVQKLWGYFEQAADEYLSQNENFLDGIDEFYHAVATACLPGIVHAGHPKIIQDLAQAERTPTQNRNIMKNGGIPAEQIDGYVVALERRKIFKTEAKIGVVIRGLNGREIAAINDDIESAEGRSKLIDQLASRDLGEMADAFKEMASTPKEIRIIFKYLQKAIIYPALTDAQRLDLAKILNEIDYYSARYIFNRIQVLSGAGYELGK